jgi:hypothetical protein
MEEETRTILRSAIEAQQPVAGGKGLASRIHDHFAQFEGDAGRQAGGRRSQQREALL